jgi:AsmA-like C-terminal region/AsmA family/Protein of unknown function
MANDTVTRTRAPLAKQHLSAREAHRRFLVARRTGLWILVSLAVFAGVVTLSAMLIIGQTLRAPDWLRDRIEARIERNLGGMQILFGDVSFVVNQGWRPRLRLRDVSLSGPDGQQIVQLSDIEASLAMRPLLRGLVQPKTILLTGAVAKLHRDKQGKIALSIGDGVSPVQRAPGLPQLIAQLDALLTSPQLAALVLVEMRALTLRYEDARQGRAWTLDGGRVRLERADGQLRAASSFSVLGGGDNASMVEMNFTSPIGSTGAEFGILVQEVPAPDIAAQGVALAWLEVLRAPISGALRGSIDSDGTLGRLSATLQIGAGVLQPTDQTRPVPFSGARSYFTYEPDEKVLIFDELSVSSAWGAGVAEGRAYLGGVASGRLRDMIGQFTLTGLSINPDGLYETPMLLDNVVADFRLEFDPFRLTLGQMQISEQNSQVLLTGTLEAAEAGWDLALDGRMDTLTPDRLVAYWPQGAAPKPRMWVARNLLGGNLRDINFALRARPGSKPDIALDFDFDKGSIRFVKTLPPVTGAAGQASLIGGRFVVTATSGLVTPDQGGPVDISGTSFIIPDVMIKKAAPGVVRLVGSGSVTSVMSLLNRPPLRVLKNTPLPVDLARGRAKVTGTLALPLKDKVQFPEFKFHLTGEIADVSSSVLVPGQLVTAPLLQITGDQSQIIVSGPGRVGDVPVEVRWRQPLGMGQARSSRLEGTVELSQRLLDTFNIGLPKGSVSGTGQGAFTLDFRPGAPAALTLKSDLRGVGLRLPQLGWRKPQAATGTLELAGTLGTAARIDRLVLNAAGLSASGSVQNRAGGGLDRALFGSVRLNGWLDVSVELLGRGANAPPDIRILGGTLDLRKASFGGGGSAPGGATGGLTVSLSRLQVTDTIALNDFSGQFRTGGGLNGEFRGKINGQTEVTGVVVPKGDRSAVRIRSANAGGVIRSAGLLTQARGGDFTMTLIPGGGPGQFDGTLRVTDTRVKDAPAIAALLNSISVIGLLDEMSGQGIQFTEVDARFRLGPSRVTVFSSSAIGPSIGLSMDGVLDVPSGQLNMRGVISPVYLLNSIGSVLTRKGEGVIGFNYTLTGPTASPQVQVNPLSALVPGMFRDLMRATPPPVDDTAPGRKPPRRSPDPSGGGAEGR